MASQLAFNSSDIDSLISSFVIVHRRRNALSGNLAANNLAGQPADFNFEFKQTTWRFWETCVRRLAFGNADFAVETEMRPGDEIFQGLKAYEFLLEIICGLHSPVKGETEVQGQFKIFCETLENGWLKKLLKHAYAESKVVRDLHLRGLGSQSYGSITRRKVRECSQVDIVGGGHLLREILPWILKLDLKIRIFVRSPEKLADLPKRNQQVEVFSLSQRPEKLGALLLLAPLSSREIKIWAAEALDGSELILDFRGESAHDNLELVEAIGSEAKSRYLPLKIIFDEIEAVKGRVDEQVAKAQNHIREKVYAPQNRLSQK